MRNVYGCFQVHESFKNHVGHENGEEIQPLKYFLSQLFFLFKELLKAQKFYSRIAIANKFSEFSYIIRRRRGGGGRARGRRSRVFVFKAHILSCCQPCNNPVALYFVCYRVVCVLYRPIISNTFLILNLIHFANLIFKCFGK